MLCSLLVRYGWSLSFAVIAPLLLLIGQEIVENGFGIHVQQNQGRTAFPFHSFGFTGQAVALGGGPGLHLAGTRDAKALFGARMGLHLWHFIFLSKVFSKKAIEAAKFAPDRLGGDCLYKDYAQRVKQNSFA